ncbi:chromate transporter [Clostridium sp. OM02-18AC]|uniref:chromate transporter n=1 Tax=Clostridium sp. OM02-18AC TaxID=2292311 RepID=UPI000E4D3A29|nr:chromate transporter [Clostridium sp. OM02-18AC]RHV63077.1 chromate transporter [Clostridium sp. OM02-18AC]
MSEKKKDKRMLWTLFKTCFLISACTFGGGMVIISMLQKKFVEELHWISEEEAMDMVAIAQSSPGVMAVNTSIIIGYHVAGLTGAILTVFGTVLPPMVILTILSACYVQFRSNYLVALILKGMQAGVVAVMMNVSISMLKNVVKDKKVTSWIMLIGAAIAAVWFKVDIILIILVCGVAGGLLSWWEYRNVPKEA